MTAFSLLEEKTHLVFLSLNHKDRLNFYEPLEDFIDEHQRVYLHVAAGNRALLIWAKENSTFLEGALQQRCLENLDRVSVRELTAEDQLPKEADMASLSDWLQRRSDWAQWHRSHPDSPAIPTRLEWLPEPPEQRHAFRISEHASDI